MLSLEVKGVSKAYGAVQALREVDFSLRRGEIHALAGENGAGKSTLMKVINGIVRPDAGIIWVHGQPVEIGSPARAQELGIGFVHQEIALCADVSVAENIFMAETNRRRSFFMNFGAIRERARTLLASLADIDPDIPAGHLTISQQQIVEIAKALTLDCSILVLDEPTAALTEHEAGKLFGIMAALKQRGISIIYISHRMVEIFDHCDRITVMRDGRYVSTDAVCDVTAEEVVGKMVGRHISHLFPAKNPESRGAPALMRVSGLTDGERFHDVSFELRRGEILGVAGLIGAGRTEIALGICGLRRRSGGRVELDGRDITPADYPASIESGIVYLSEDRKGSGVFLDLAISANVSALNLEQVSTRYGFVSSRRETEQARRLADALNLKRGSLSDPVSSLSGGNQQKVALAKLLSVSPKVILLDEPTRGVDVGAKAEIHRILRDLANRGTGIMVISSELPEIIGLCDRALVVHEGRIAGEVAGDDVTDDNIIRLASGLGQRARENA